jgi:hypothetical protein
MFPSNSGCYLQRLPTSVSSASANPTVALE